MAGIPGELAGAGERHHRQGKQPRAGTNVHDHAAFAFSEMRQNGSGDIHKAEPVDVELLLDLSL
ncbi:MAG: hypothetical protein JWO80_5085 [Bryobacterales bacterium]|nr:hypothetical protein [Bryobacterales bacterium]